MQELSYRYAARAVAGTVTADGDGRQSLIPFQQWKAAYPSLAVLALPNNAVIYRQGEPQTQSFYVVSGYVKLSRVTLEGQEFTVAIVPAGELFGVLCTDADNAPCQETAVAKGTVRLYRFRMAAGRAVLPQQAELAQQVVRSLAKRASFLQRRLEYVLTKDVQGRVAAMLCELITRYGGKCGHGHEIDIRLTQQELAELIGASRPVVSTVLNDLRRRGILSYTRHFICIDDIDALRQYI